MYEYKIKSEGEIIKITGPVIDVRFAEDQANPSINTILYAKHNDSDDDAPVWMEVASQVGENVVRCIALEATEGLACGMRVFNNCLLYTSAEGTYCGRRSCEGYGHKRAVRFFYNVRCQFGKRGAANL